MSYTLVRARLDEACVPLPVPSTEEGYVPIGRSFPWPTLAIACGWRPSHVGDSVLPAVLRRFDRAAEEISQLLYHVQVLMIARGIGLDEVYKHL